MPQAQTTDTNPKISLRLANGSTAVLATASVITNGLRISGFKVLKSKYNRGVFVSPPSKKGEYGYFNTIGFNDKKLEQRIKTLILEAYKDKQNKKSTRRASRARTIIMVRQIPLKLLFHIYRHHKSLITEFRMWFAARFVVDQTGCGYVHLDKIARATNVSLRYTRSMCRKSEFFHHSGRHAALYRSLKNMITLHKLYAAKGKIRGERITRSFMNNVTSHKRFKGYITRCFAENDISKRIKNITAGRIGYLRMADKFGISKKTAIGNIKVSCAKKHDNFRYFPEIRFRDRSEFQQWLLQNMDKSLDGERIEDNPRSYFHKWWTFKNGKRFILAKRKPNLYLFTGTFQRSVRTRKGQR